jgi:8-oxo-dGTP pyrophosphatase MutT (NUDIX family)
MLVTSRRDRDADALRGRVRQSVVARQPIDDSERACIAEFLSRFDALSRPFDEDADPVHVTGSAVVVGPRGVILIKHKSLAIWLQPGGHVEPDETPWDGALREAREETGLDVVVGNLIGLYSSDGETVVLAVYEATSTGEPCAGDDLTEVGWFFTSELPELAFPRDRRIIDAWLTAQPDVGRRTSERGPSDSPNYRLPTPDSL